MFTCNILGLCFVLDIIKVMESEDEGSSSGSEELGFSAPSGSQDSLSGGIFCFFVVKYVVLSEI